MHRTWTPDSPRVAVFGPPQGSVRLKVAQPGLDTWRRARVRRRRLGRRRSFGFGGLASRKNAKAGLMWGLGEATKMIFVHMGKVTHGHLGDEQNIDQPPCLQRCRLGQSGFQGHMLRDICISVAFGVAKATYETGFLRFCGLVKHLYSEGEKCFGGSKRGAWPLPRRSGQWDDHWGKKPLHLDVRTCKKCPMDIWGARKIAGDPNRPELDSFALPATFLLVNILTLQGKMTSLEEWAQQAGDVVLQ